MCIRDSIKGIETTARVDMFFFVVEIGIVLIIVIGGLKYVLGGGGAGELTMTPIYQADKVNLTFIEMCIRDSLYYSLTLDFGPACVG